jgi:zinc D-Ala-D-Ala carboxypeptidase
MLRCYEPPISPAYRKPHTRPQHRAAFNGGVTYRRTRIRRLRVAVLLVVLGAMWTALGDQALDSSSSPAPAPLDVPHGAHRELGSAVPDGTTVFDDDVPGVARLDPALLRALRRAATDGGVELFVDSGRRSPEYQAKLLREAVSKYGSYQEAARWVATPATSAHVSGDAVDIASSGAAWLSEHGAAYGLCRIYGNEPWHFELRPAAVADGCPPMYADPTHDPRMQQ